MAPQTLEQGTLRKVAWKLVPFLCLLYVFNILDRANLGFARLQMQDDLDMSQEMFDLGYGLFYIGYLLFEVPSNLLLRRVGARRWIARIMISWGLISCLTMFVYDATSFYVIRILLGVAEAGFFPGIILYLSYWFPDRERAKMTAYFMLAIALASVFGNPLSGLIMYYLDGASNLDAWQWLFLLEGFPSIILGVIVLFKMVDGPAQAGWLTPNERDWLVERIQREGARSPGSARRGSIERLVGLARLVVDRHLLYGGRWLECRRGLFPHLDQGPFRELEHLADRFAERSTPSLCGDRNGAV